MLGISGDTVRRWAGSPHTGPGGVVHKATLTAWVSFLDLVEMHIALEIKKETGLSIFRLKKLLREAAALRGVDHPLARQKYLIDGAKVWMPAAEGLVDLGTAGQLGLPAVVRKVARALDFDVEGIAERWYPQGRLAGTERRPVVVDPRVSFGRPTLRGTRVNTEILYDMWESEGKDAEVVASLYNLPVADVEEAVAFEVAMRQSKAA